MKVYHEHIPKLFRGEDLLELKYFLPEIPNSLLDRGACPRRLASLLDCSKIKDLLELAGARTPR
jgi:hypothetical protein